MKTLAQEKASNALTYFAKRIKSIQLKKAIKLLQIADQIAINQTGVPIVWIKDIPWNGYVLGSRKEFDDSQFCDYEIDIMEMVINQYAGYSDKQLLNFEMQFSQMQYAEFKKAAYELAYQSHLMEDN